MEPTKETLPKKRVAPAAHRSASAGYSGASLSPPVQKKQNKTGLPDQLKEADRTGEKSLTISSTVQAKKVNSSAPIPMVIQRAPGDEPLLRFLEEQSIQARDGFVLMGHQTEVALEQVDRLENLVLSDELARYPDILQIQMNVADAATQLRGQIPQSQAAVQGDHDTVIARADAATIATPGDILSAWTIEAVEPGLPNRDGTG